MLYHTHIYILIDKNTTREKNPSILHTVYNYTEYKMEYILIRSGR